LGLTTDAEGKWLGKTCGKLGKNSPISGETVGNDWGITRDENKNCKQDRSFYKIRSV